MSKQKEEPKRYVVWYAEHMRDETPEGAKVVDSLDKAAAFIDRLANGFCGSNMEFAVFELGPRVPLAFTKVEEPQPSKVTRKAVVG